MTVALHGSAADRWPLRRGDVANLLGVAETDLPPATRAAIDAADFTVAPLAGEALARQEERVRAALRRPLAVSGPERHGDWEAGWGDLCARYVASGDLADLEPHYFRKPSQVMRVRGRYVRPQDPRFEARFVRVLQCWLAERWLGGDGPIFEFGCGPGHNVVAFAQLLPGREVVGLDWARPSQEILAAVAARTGLPVRGRRIDLFAPDRELALPDGATAVTIGAMEQLGTRFGVFLDWLLARRPRLCVHLEPLHELYDRALPFDDAAARYAERRGYLRGYLPRLRDLARDGAVELLCVQRHLGSEFHDGWGSLVWRPLGDGEHPRETRR